MRRHRSLLLVLPILPIISIVGGLVGAAAATIQTPAGVQWVDEAQASKLLAKNAAVRKLGGGLQFIEGPVWVAEPAGGYLVFSDIPANELKRWDAAGGVRTFRAPSGNTNGNTLDREGRLLHAEHSGRIARTERDGRIVTVLDAVDGRKLSSPNDVVVKSDGTIWFTDPTYGLAPRKQETAGNFVYRFDPATSRATAVVRDADQPNGLAFSPKEDVLYVADSGKPRSIRAFAVRPDGTLDQGRVLASITPGSPDGIRCDELGNVWTSSGDGVQVFSPNGVLIARVLLPESAANLAFGGPDGRTLFMTARTSLYAIDTLVRGAARPR
ncbi:MAG: SMP-30/gluconolactonase/LRE family protein [Acidobacteria bacterium]|nr:SMP-30/gluconolactonase/LRE family protein [Acidobacteriota bacterium]